MKHKDEARYVCNNCAATKAGEKCEDCTMHGCQCSCQAPAVASPDRAEELAREIVLLVCRVTLSANCELNEFAEPMVDRVAALLRSRMAERWIPVSERLPEEGVYVLAANGPTQWIVRRNGITWNKPHFQGKAITHWRPLPSAPDTEKKA